MHTTTTTGTMTGTPQPRVVLQFGDGPVPGGDLPRLYRLVDQRPGGSNDTAHAVIERLDGIDAMCHERWLPVAVFKSQYLEADIQRALMALLNALADATVDYGGPQATTGVTGNTYPMDITLTVPADRVLKVD